MMTHDANAAASPPSSAPSSAPVRQGHQFDEARLAAWMSANVEGYEGPLVVEQFEGGQSNPTFKLRTPARNYVMRRKPAGMVFSSAHAVDREYRVLNALQATGLPVPRTAGLCLDEAVIGSWFYVMEMVEGRIFWESHFPGVPADQRPLYFDSMNETIARLHAVDPEAIGLGDFGRPGAYIERQIARFSKQYQADVEAGRLPVMDRLIEWLSANVPAEADRTIVHGDYKSGNMIFHPTEPRVIAVLDWELSTLGDPLADFAFNAMMYRAPPSVGSSLVGLDHAVLNIPAEQDYVAAYCRRTGRSGIPNLSYYIAFNMFRLAAIIHGIKGRVLRGNASSADAPTHAAKLETMAQAAWKQVERAQRGE